MSKAEWLVSCYGQESEACIHWLEMDDKTGKMNCLGKKDGIIHPSFLARHPYKNRLYAISEVEEGEVVCYEIDRDNHQLMERNRLATNGGPCYVEAGRNGQCLFVCNYSKARISVYTLWENGDLKEEVEQIIYPAENGEETRIHTIRQVPNTDYIIATDIGKSKLYIYKWEEMAAELNFIQEVSVPDQAGPRHIAFHPDQPIFYVVNEYQSTVVVYAYEDHFSNVELIQCVETVSDEQNTTNYGAEIQYVDGMIITSNRGHDSLTFFHVQKDGLLQKQTDILTGGNWPRHFFCDSCSGYRLFVMNQHSNNITIFQRDQDTFLPLGYAYSIKEPVCIIDL